MKEILFVTTSEIVEKIWLRVRELGSDARFLIHSFIHIVFYLKEFSLYFSTQ